MVSSVAGHYKWTPHYITENLYVDDYDIFGLCYWYEIVKKQVEEIKQKIPKK